MLKDITMFTELLTRIPYSPERYSEYVQQVWDGIAYEEQVLLEDYGIQRHAVDDRDKDDVAYNLAPIFLALQPLVYRYDSDAIRESLEMLELGEYLQDAICRIARNCPGRLSDYDDCSYDYVNGSDAMLRIVEVQLLYLTQYLHRAKFSDETNREIDKAMRRTDRVFEEAARRRYPAVWMPEVIARARQHFSAIGYRYTAVAPPLRVYAIGCQVNPEHREQPEDK